ncbi:lipocalin-like domain-containing protein [Aestuariirhabdus sp. LZHN29]|uniref:lipocalin-like domain-containing protein n=1 Tax=Aestuariirhabdus sp. LZHN29 TaxID=3417462 RepID=UPI003CEEB0CF
MKRSATIRLSLLAALVTAGILALLTLHTESIDSPNGHLKQTPGEVETNATQTGGDRDLTLGSLLGEGAAGPVFPQVSGPRPFSFPRDHIGHPEYRSEWWYFTGQLRSPESPEFRYGFQFTIFRHALTPLDTHSEGWNSPQIYMGHLALTDFESGQHLASEMISRAGPDIAGSALEPPRVWIKNWRIESLRNSAWLPLMLTAQDPLLPLDLNLVMESGAPIVLQGDQGFSPKGPNTASHYYSYPRLKVSGSISTDNAARIAVEGQAWFDHEWGSSYLENGQLGWDWFSLQLDNGMTLMWFEIRSSDPKLNTRAITLVDARGNRLSLEPKEVDVKISGYWDSPDSRRYPSGWRIHIPRYQLDLSIEPRVKDQEMHLTVVYWEGAVAVSGSHTGAGYVELSGY